MLKPGTLLGPYEVLSLIGAGGMGEVYKGRDTRLNRIVAIKTLPAHLTERPELRERFKREATTLANLKHAHICVLYDIGSQELEVEGTKEAEEVREAKESKERQGLRPAGLPGMESRGGRRSVRIDFLVMEYLEGETLAERLKKGPLPLEQVLQYACEISDALITAHRQGFVHRDIKPGNLMLTKAGSKILDFGLAKLKQEVAKATIPSSEMPTALGTLTQHGTLLGTLHYMAPEQVEGRTDDLDARTDIFAFGAVVYEMVTGKKSFDGKTPASVIAKILETTPPPMSTLQPMTPPILDRVVKTCLAKDPDERWQTARDLWRELTWIREGSLSPAVQAPVAEMKPAAKGWRTIPASTTALIAAVVAVVVGLAVWTLKPAAPLPAPSAPLRLTVNLPPGEQLGDLDTPSLALSPDGSQLAYVARRGRTTQLYIRAMDRLETKPIPATEGAQAPFFSPDGQWIGFFAQGKLKKVSITGGSLQTLCDAGAPNGGSWGPDDTIFFAPANVSGLWKVSASGGKPQEVTKLDRAKGEFSHRWPQVLPGGKALLFTVVTGPGWDESHVVAQVYATSERHLLAQVGRMGRYTPSGQLVYWRIGTLLALPFDLARLEVTGSNPVTIAEGVMVTGTIFGPLGAQFEAASTGSLAYLPLAPHQYERRLVWVDRKGEVQPIPAPPRAYLTPALSPDGRQIAVDIPSNTWDTWIYDLARGTLTRLASEASSSQWPIWTPDGKRVTYRGTRAGFRNVYWKLADGTGLEERLSMGENVQDPFSWSPDGKVLAFVEQSPTTGGDIWTLRIEGDRKPQAFLKTPFSETAAQFSPDGRWLAYQSNESGRDEIYVQPFSGPGGKWQVSTEGGSEARWAPSGRELFYRSGDRMMAVEVSATSSSFGGGKPRLLFEGKYLAGGFAGNYSVSPDGQRFLMIQSVEPEQPATQINLVLNWQKTVTSGK